MELAVKENIFAVFFTHPFLFQYLGLHCLQRRPRHLPSPHSWSLPKEAIPKGIMPYRWTIGMLFDEEGP